MMPPEVRARIDEYLDAVERALAQAGHSREERRAVTDDLEAQIREMLSKRVSGAPTEADVVATLQQLEPPAAYAQSVGPGSATPAPPTPPTPPAAPAILPARPSSTPAAPPSRLSRAAIWGAVFVILSLLAIPFLLVLGMLFWAAPVRSPSSPSMPAIEVAPERVQIQPAVPSRPATRHQLEPGAAAEARPAIPLAMAAAPIAPAEGPTTHAQAAPPARLVFETHSRPTVWANACLFIPLALIGGLLAASPFLGTLLGWIAILQIRRSKGRLYGLGLALFDALFYPLLLVNAVVLILIGRILTALGLPDVVAIPLTLLACLALTVGIVWLLNHLLRGRRVHAVADLDLKL